jgi:hypothetical protein
MEKPEVLFEKWYVTPLRMLQALPCGDGGFVALATTCFLYERYVTAVIKSLPHKSKSDKDARITQFIIDFGVDEETARAFWDVIRDGLLHEGMPKQLEHGKKDLPQWAFRHDFSQPVELVKYDGKQVLKVQPWLVMEKVILLWQQNLGLVDKNDSFPWANVVPLPF